MSRRVGEGAAVPEHGEFPRNLQYLAAHYRSVAEVCRRIGINRQQFNKYLSGTTTPSIHNFKRIADFFGVDESELLLPHAEFLSTVMHRPIGLDVPEALRGFLHDWRPKLDASRKAMERYEGYYHAYFLSPAWPGGILCSLYAIFSDDRLTYVKSIERLAWVQKDERDFFVHKYQGMALFDSNRLYLFECQPHLTSLYSMTILYPTNRSRVKTLTGLLASVTGGVSRNPYASRTLFRRLDMRRGLRGALERCGVYPFESEEIDPDIRACLDNTTAGPTDVLVAREY